MKRYLNQIILLAGSAMVMFSSCIKEQSTVVFDGGTAPVLTSTATDSIPLPISDTTATAVTFNWTNPGYTFNNGISSLDVNYYLEIDTLGANFTSPLMAQIGISFSLSQTFTVSQLNGVLTSAMQLDTSIMHHIQVRVESYLTPLTSGSANAAALYSDTLNYTVTPYATPPVVAPPSNDSLYIVGAAVLADNWANPIPAADVPSETFTKISPTKYQITVALIGGGEYKLISQNNGSWTYQWSVATKDTEPTGGPFIFNGANCIAPAASGTYTIVVNFQTGTFTVTLQ
jgi:starch-binding outer membrane protein SusE/F